MGVFVNVGSADLYFGQRYYARSEDGETLIVELFKVEQYNGQLSFKFHSDGRYLVMTPEEVKQYDFDPIN